ncbi:MAG: hypothetical protein CMP91_05895 [Gammaproteobacteria bacterium]|nr:hypothetical protein [Gammaproteobacteria bacterium]MAY02885.1 hypothetical protein [Gammaproteobacteria bacterium]|tara:strand:- start:189 stop:464 length:276 start_codon:yes stop_codon:yes gene_type:complete
MSTVLRSASGRETVSELSVRSREVKNDGDQLLENVDSLADVKSTGFLSHTPIADKDTQWLYLLALKRVKQISPADKSSPFMGSEFIYAGGS